MMGSHSKILNAIFRHAAENPDKTAILTVDGENVSYSQLSQYIRLAASFLIGLGLEKGDCIMLSAQKEVEFVYLYFGAHLAGIVNLVVDANTNQDNIRYITEVVKPKAVIGFEVEDCKCIKYADITLYKSLEPFSKETDIDEDSAADIMFTSGTTGKPKGVLLSHFNIYSSADNINRFIGNTADDVELLGLPICHSFGLGRLRCNMLTGATVVFYNGFANLKSVFAAFERYSVTGFGMVPAVWAYIKRFSGTRIGKYASQMRYIEIGSAAMPTEDKELLMNLFPDTRICMHYGLTEASRAVFMEFHENCTDLSTAGKSVVPEVDVCIMRDDGVEAACEEEGEVCIKGNMVTNSYFLPEDNENAFINGYFRTGDWGRKSPDGRIYLVARKKELINVGGKKVSPIEIEDALERIGVGESMCVSVKDDVLGEVPKALLVEGTFSKDIKDIQESLSKMLEPYKQPKFYEVVKSIPKTASGKKKRTI